MLIYKRQNGQKIAFICEKNSLYYAYGMHMAGSSFWRDSTDEQKENFALRFGREYKKLETAINKIEKDFLFKKNY
jgi:hypothetical protein